MSKVNGAGPGLFHRPRRIAAINVFMGQQKAIPHKMHGSPALLARAPFGFMAVLDDAGDGRANVASMATRKEPRSPARIDHRSTRFVVAAFR
jgi:hypothetical protein